MKCISDYIIIWWKYKQLIVEQYKFGKTFWQRFCHNSKMSSNNGWNWLDIYNIQCVLSEMSLMWNYIHYHGVTRLNVGDLYTIFQSRQISKFQSVLKVSRLTIGITGAGTLSRNKATIILLFAIASLFTPSYIKNNPTLIILWLIETRVTAFNTSVWVWLPRKFQIVCCEYSSLDY